MVRVDTRREVLRLYREILRTSRKFHWPNEQGELWSTVLKKNARLEIEGARYETQRSNTCVCTRWTDEQDRETISKRIIVGWECVKEVHSKFQEKQSELFNSQSPQEPKP